MALGWHFVQIPSGHGGCPDGQSLLTRKYGSDRGGIKELPSSGLFVAELILRRYEWNDRFLIFRSARYSGLNGSKGMQ